METSRKNVMLDERFLNLDSKNRTEQGDDALHIEKLLEVPV